MTNDDTIPTIAELKGNTILELLSNVYTTLKNAIFRKQSKLVAGDNIVIDEDTNRISAIVGGEPVLDDYYTKSETDTLLNAKANSTDVYNKTEDDALFLLKADKSDTYTKTQVDSLISGIDTNIEVITPTLSAGSYGRVTFNEELKDGDIIICNLYDLSNNKVFNLVTSAINITSATGSQSTCVSISRTDSTNALISVIRYNLWYIDGIYQIGNERNDITISSGNITSIGAYSHTDLSPIYSKVTIYRRRVE